jgi:hypothetical protein
MLGKGTSCVDLLIGREDVAGKDSVSFLILTSNLYLGLVLHLLYLYSRVGEGASPAGSDLMDFGALDLLFCLDFLSTGGADTGTSGHFDSSCSPVNLWIVFFSARRVQV